MSDARIAALRSMIRDARAARVADKLPEGRRPQGFAISISLGKPSPHDEPDEDDTSEDLVASDKDKTYPGQLGPGATPSMALGDPRLDEDEEDEDEGY